MNTKNLSLIFLLVFGVVIIFGAGIYAGLVVKDLNMPGVVSLRLTKPENNGSVPPQKTALATERKAVLSFLPLSGNKKIGQVFCAKIILDSPLQAVYGVDVLVNYDPNVLELMPFEAQGSPIGANSISQIELAGGNMIIKEWGNGKIVFSKLAEAQQSWQNEKELIDLCFKPLQKTTADLKFFFDKDSTSDCNVAGENGQDILGQVYDARFNIVD